MNNRDYLKPSYPLADILKVTLEVAKKAGDSIIEVYNRPDFEVQLKSDDSPLTQADLAAHQVIDQALARHFPRIPRLSEESQVVDFASRKAWRELFIIDPLDGTKEFIARNGEFTVNIALVIEGRPVLGVIYAPVLKTFYFAAQGSGAYKQRPGHEPESIKVRSLAQTGQDRFFTVVASRRHGLDQVAALCRNFKHYDLTSKGSSLKMCLVAEGLADFYPRLAPTSEWDTAAAQVIVEQAGGRLVRLDFTPLDYNQKDSLLNPHFLVLGDPDYDWQANLVIEA